MSGLSRWTVRIVAVSSLVILALSPALAQEPPEKPRSPITVSKATTHILGPLDDQGYVDYLAALNQIQSKGVTVENNAAVLFWQAVGPAKIDKKVRARHFKLLGIPKPPKKGEYLQSLPEYEEHLKKIGRLPSSIEDDENIEKTLYDQLDESHKRPWSKDEFPVLAGWLKVNEKPLELIVKASTRPRWYSPLVAKDDDNQTVIECLLPAAQSARDALRVLLTRSTLRLHEGDIQGAKSDLLACHRLGRLVAQGPFLVEVLVGIAIDGMAVQGDVALAHHGKLTAKQARAFQAELRDLPPMARIIDKFELGERFFFLDAVNSMARDGIDSFDDLSGKEQDLFDQVIRNMAQSAIDWDLILTMGNSYYDRMVAAGKATRAERDAADEKLNRDLEQMAKDAKKPMKVLGNLLSGQSPRQMVSRRIGGMLVALLLPSTSAAIQAGERGDMNFGMGQVALALAAYRAENGKYPQRLEQLVPKYIEKIPDDVYSDGPILYKREGKGYVLYSVGYDGVDNGGADYDPEGVDDHDDVLRVGGG